MAKTVIQGEAISLLPANTTTGAFLGYKWLHPTQSERSSKLCKATNCFAASAAILENHRGSGFLNVPYYTSFSSSFTNAVP